MPRVTRAALRSQEIQEEADLAASTPLPLTPIKARAPLGEISHNKVHEIEPVVNSEEQMGPAKKGKGKKGKSVKKSTKQDKENKEQTDVEVLEDGNESSNSLAVEEACKDLLEDNLEDHPQTIMDDHVPQTPPSAAVNALSQQLSTRAATPYFNPDIHTIDAPEASDITDDKEDSFIATIGSRTPAKFPSAGVTDTSSIDFNQDDSFVEQIKTRSPNKRMSRIEDSVEALDALEEEIEKVRKLIPTSTGTLDSPVKTKEQTKTATKALDKKTSGSLRVKTSNAAMTNPLSEQISTNVRPSMSRPLVHPAAKRVIAPKPGLSQRKPEIKSRNPPLLGTALVSAPSTLASKRVSSIHKAPFIPTKSTKPPTRASFELPGEALSRKLKEQREERQKREEEEKQSKQPVFKARPVRISRAPEVKLTTAAKLRLSMVKGVHAPAVVTTKDTPNANSAPRAATVVSRDENKRLSSLTAAKCTAAAKPSANTSARVTRGPSLDASTIGTRRPVAPRAAPTAGDLAHQKMKGKEVFERTRVEIQERENAKKEKEDAAKKARIEAAERGRLASREWAEKHKAKKMEAEKTKEHSA